MFDGRVPSTVFKSSLCGNVPSGRVRTDLAAPHAPRWHSERPGPARQPGGGAHDEREAAAARAGAVPRAPAQGARRQCFRFYRLTSLCSPEAKRGEFLTFNLKHFPAVFHRFLHGRHSRSVEAAEALRGAGGQVAPSFSLGGLCQPRLLAMAPPLCDASPWRGRRRPVAAETPKTPIESAGPGWHRRARCRGPGNGTGRRVTSPLRNSGRTAGRPPGSGSSPVGAATPRGDLSYTPWGKGLCSKRLTSLPVSTGA